MTRYEMLKKAANLPKGNPTRRKIIAAVSKEKLQLIYAAVFDLEPLDDPEEFLQALLMPPEEGVAFLRKHSWQLDIPDMQKAQQLFVKATVKKATVYYIDELRSKLKDILDAEGFPNSL